MSKAPNQKMAGHGKLLAGPTGALLGKFGESAAMRNHLVKHTIGATHNIGGAPEFARMS